MKSLPQFLRAATVGLFFLFALGIKAEAQSEKPTNTRPRVVVQKKYEHRIDHRSGVEDQAKGQLESKERYVLDKNGLRVPPKTKHRKLKKWKSRVLVCPNF